jgi:hypothetical protein
VALSETLKSLKNAHMRPEQSTDPGLELPFCDPIFLNKSFLTITQSVLRLFNARRK